MTREIGVKRKPSSDRLSGRDSSTIIGKPDGWQHALATGFSGAKLSQAVGILLRSVVWLAMLGEPKKPDDELFQRRVELKSRPSKKKKHWNRGWGHRPEVPADMRPALVLVIVGAIALGWFVVMGVMDPGDRIALGVVIVAIALLKARRLFKYRHAGASELGSSDADPDAERDGSAHDSRHQRAEKEVIERKRRRSKEKAEDSSGTRTIGAPDRQKSKVKSKADVIDWD